MSRMTRFRLASLPLNTLSLVPLQIFRAKVSHSPQTLEGKEKALELAYYISYHDFSGFVRGKIFLALEKPGAKFFRRPYLYKI